MCMIRISFGTLRCWVSLLSFSDIFCMVWSMEGKDISCVFTFGFHSLNLDLTNFRADTYSVCILLAAGIKSPSALLTTTKCATSTIPFFMPIMYKNIF